MIRSEVTRQRIIEQTASIFNKQGYTGTYLSDLTKATGLTKGSIYGNFKDKNEVAIEAFRYNFSRLASQVSTQMNQEKTSFGKLLSFIDFYEHEYKQVFANGGCVILNTAIDADDVNPDLRKEVVKAIGKWKNALVDIMKTGLENQELTDLDPDLFANFMIGLIEGSIMMAKTLNDPGILIQNLDLIRSQIKSRIKR